MIIKANECTREIVIRGYDGDRLEAPIRVIFSNKGTARVKAGVGELLCDLFDSITIINTEESED